MERAIREIEQFREERDWKKFHNEKDLAISISLEANELLELFQWKNPEEVIATNLDRVKEELADVLIYTIMMSNNLNLNVEKIVLEKIQTNKEKYPVELSKGSNKKYTEL